MNDTSRPERRSGWLREPLLHFLLLGAGIFALNSWLGEPRVEAAQNEVVVGPARIDNLIALFAKTWKRAPTPDELRGLIEDHVLEEVLVREALALGLDQDDTVVRRRLRQKMEFVVDDVVDRLEPTEDELERWLAENVADYALPSRVSFRQVYLNPERRGEGREEDAGRLLAELRAAGPGVDALQFGDATLLDHAWSDITLEEVALSFGPGFAEELEGVEVGEWSGPIDSVYGTHVVVLDERRAGRTPVLDEVRAAVERDWHFDRRMEGRRRYEAELFERYRIRIEWPEDLLPSDPEAEDRGGR